VSSTVPTPSPSASFNPDLVTPGVWGFVVVLAIAVLTILLIVDMTRRIRRTRYAADVRERAEAERQAADRAGTKPPEQD
jgi:hypothetical protein